MASTSCWKCLLRPSVSPASYGIGNASIRVPAIATFSTTSTVSYPPKPAAGGARGKPAKPTKAGKTLKIKKKAFVKTGRPPAPGERKAARKRIVLSNTNALEVAGLVDMTPEILLDPAQVGKVLGIPGPVVDQLRAVEAFKITQGWGLFRRPAMLVREESIEVAKIMKDAAASGKTVATVLDGDRSTGKSMMLLHAMATAFVNKWIVMNIPEAQELTTAATDYSPVPGTKLFSQNVYAANWLGQIIKANDAILSELVITQKHELPIPIPDNISLSRLAELGSKDHEIAWPIFQAVWTEITAKGRPPVLLTLDGLHHIMKDSAYRNPDYELIHSHDLATVKFFVDYLSGAKTLPNGGAVFAATSKSNCPVAYAVDISCQQKNDAKLMQPRKEALLASQQAGIENKKQKILALDAPQAEKKKQLTEEIARLEQKHAQEAAAAFAVTQLDPYKILDTRAYETLKHADLIKLKGLSKHEAKGLMEYWAASGVLRQRVDERTVTEKWAISGGGVVGEIQRNALWMRI